MNSEIQFPSKNNGLDYLNPWVKLREDPHQSTLTKRNCLLLQQLRDMPIPKFSRDVNLHVNKIISLSQLISVEIQEEEAENEMKFPQFCDSDCLYKHKGWEERSFRTKYKRTTTSQVLTQDLHWSCQSQSYLF
jgi:hypothetical protein